MTLSGSGTIYNKGTVTGAVPASYTVVNAPAINTDLPPQTAYSGGSDIVIRADATGSGITYEWYVGGFLQNETGDTLTLTGSPALNGVKVFYKIPGDGFFADVISSETTLVKNYNCAEDGHDPVAVKGYPAGCLADGLSDGAKCSVCGEILTAQKTITAKGHTEEIIKGYPAGCLTDGLSDGVKCSVCGEILTAQKPITAKGHTEEIVKGYPAACLADGLSDGAKCSVCGEILTAQKPITAKGHTEEIVKGYPATCLADGLSDGVKCSVCGETLTAQKPITAKGHTEEIVKGYPAGCLTDGLSDGVKCSVCGETLTAQKPITAEGHKDDGNGVCSVCGEKLADEAETDPAENCPCGCHKTGRIVTVIYRTRCFFW